MVIDKTNTGYIFPNIPRDWQREERFFALELRNLFDVLFTRTRGLDGDWDKLTYEKLSKKPKINGVELVGNKTSSDIGIKVVSNVNNGLMTPVMKRVIAYSDYTTMMTEVEVPIDTAERQLARVADYYEDTVWNLTMVWDAVGKWITSDDYEEITGETYDPNHRPGDEEPEENE